MLWACSCQITTKPPPNRFLVPIHLGVEPKIMSLGQIFTSYFHFNDIGRVVAGILLHYLVYFVGHIGFNSNVMVKSHQ